MLLLNLIKLYSFKERVILLYNFLFGEILPFGHIYIREAVAVIKASPSSFKLEFEQSEYNNILIKFMLNAKAVQLEIRKKSSDFAVFKQVFIENEYEGLINDIKRFPYSIDADVTMLDVGANVGFTTVYVKSYFPSLKILAIEPYSPNVIQMKRNLSLNNISSVVVFEGGIWTNNAILSFKTDFLDSREWAVALVDDGKADGVLCKTISTLKQDFNLEKIDIIKMDIEGGEKELFMNDNFLSVLNEINVLAVEIHKEIIEETLIHNILRKYKFEIFVKGETTFAYKN
jgi:FkbM family methyltransferase